LQQDGQRHSRRRDLSDRLSLPKIPSGAQFAQQRALRANGARSEAGCNLNFEWSDLIEIEEPIDMESMR
jgi:hypothetical protein